MKPPISIVKDLVLVGGGHSHVLALRMLAMRPVAGLRITLVSPASHTPYSGMLPGMVAGHYSFEDAHIDLARLSQWAGVRFIMAEVTGLDASSKRLNLRDRPAIDYDLVSLDVGSQPELDSVPGAAVHALPVKPVAGLWRRWEALRHRLEQRSDQTPSRIAIVGGGAGSVELALAMAHRLPQGSASIALYCGADQILQGYNERARQTVMEALSAKAVSVFLSARVAAVEHGVLALPGGKSAGFDELFWCTGATAAPWIAASGLPVDEQGFLQVSDTLQSPADAAVFAAGDIATQIDHPRPKAGVFAVRQGPVLAHNLRAALLGKALRQYRPQQRFLSLLSLGDKTATADRGSFSISGKWVWHWKDRIDRKFMARFERLPTHMPSRYWGALFSKEDQHSAAGAVEEVPEQAPCGGCGAKVGATDLKQALHELAEAFPQNRSELLTADDVAAIPNAGGAPLFQSIDVLRALVGDPWIMGRLAANHALSDLYASGVKPVSALALVVLAFASERPLQRDLKQLLAGALYEFGLAGCVLSGGHSMQGPELCIGFTVTGQAMRDNEQPLAKGPPAVGDKLILTKPLGTGVLFAGHMQLRADGRDISSAIRHMVQSNGPAAELALTYNASACTDITGFGLFGHLSEMLGQQCGAQLVGRRLPLLPGAFGLLRDKIRSTAHRANQAASLPLQVGEGVAANLVHIGHDPQTSGGLLIAVHPDGAEALVVDLQAAGYRHASMIGEVTALEPTRPPLLVH